MRYLFKNRRNSFTVIGVGCPANQPALKKYWRAALKRTLRVVKRNYGIEYILLFERSPNGFEHAHALLTQRTKASFYRLDTYTLRLVRVTFFRSLLQLIENKSKYAYQTASLNELTRALDVSKKMVYATRAKKQKDGGIVIPGRGTGFIDYLLKKPELVLKDSATVSSGLLELRMSRIKIHEPKGWDKEYA